MHIHLCAVHKEELKHTCMYKYRHIQTHTDNIRNIMILSVIHCGDCGNFFFVADTNSGGLECGSL